MTSIEINELYSQIEKLDLKEIEELVIEDINKSDKEKELKKLMNDSISETNQSISTISHECKPITEGQPTTSTNINIGAIVGGANAAILYGGLSSRTAVAAAAPITTIGMSIAALSVLMHSSSCPNYTFLYSVCKYYWKNYNEQIQEIIKKHPKVSKSIADIIILLAPTIAQQYTGFSGMAIVGTLTIIAKQNLGL